MGDEILLDSKGVDLLLLFVLFLLLVMDWSLLVMEVGMDLSSKAWLERADDEEVSGDSKNPRT